MRDGVVLYADVYRPSDEGPWPIIVARAPYGKSGTYENSFLDPLTAIRQGLIAVIQDVRGRYASGGYTWQPGAADAHEGFDTIAWAASLSGSNGRVGMWGPSYMGNVQWPRARSTSTCGRPARCSRPATASGCT
ncbi:CocE/NonD family hydrolase [Planosporangium thailandense]|uniref:CocE/NonD family hydrolase n=1 Tax=Planosporangium thailandense TaxID=765197 RepID=A0ABX0XV08_9ACTN|nr:CocE/NonD family hydrolase [Planosporangium thailandense]